MKVDEICEDYSKENVSLSIRLLEEDSGARSTTVLIEGPSRALRMLAELLAAVADGDSDDGFSISPFGAGRSHFSPESELGIYIHRLHD